MQSYTYLVINFMTAVICFIFSFDKRIQFSKHFGSFLKASFIVAIPFIIWDLWFTKMGVWWFNTNYIIGLKIWILPLEEWMFFLCIPFSCVFTYFCLDKFFNLNWANYYNKFIVWITVIVCITMASIFSSRIYTFMTALITSGTVLYLYYIAKSDWIGKGSLIFFILMLGFFPVNGVLTGTGLESPIVNYNPNDILNIRMLTIPIEDAVYGYSQFMLVIYFFKLFQNKKIMKNKTLLKTTLSLVTLVFLSSCSNIPKNAKPVENFDISKYLGTWYEIARYDYKFEKNLDNTMAQYTLEDNDKIKVCNSGYNAKSKKWTSITGTAKFRGDNHKAALKVTFFKPFYAAYNVIAIDKNYNYALVTGSNLNYLWLLSRKKTMPEDIKQKYIKTAQNIGYDTSKLIWVKQNKTNPFVNEK